MRPRAQQQQGQMNNKQQQQTTQQQPTQQQQQQPAKQTAPVAPAFSPAPSAMMGAPVQNVAPAPTPMV